MRSAAALQGCMTEQWGDVMQGYSRESVVSLLVTREVTEHANVYHTLTDLLNVYISLRMLGLDKHDRWQLHQAHTPQHSTHGMLLLQSQHLVLTTFCGLIFWRYIAAAC